jgi:hypothetical protein
MDDAAVDAAIAPTAEEEAPAPEAPAPKRKSRAKAKPQAIEEPQTPRAERAERAEPVADPSLLWAAVLKTQRAMEKEARSAKLSSLRIV